jgi:hypothetical protein
MPTHVSTLMKVVGSESEIDKLLNYVKSNENEFDFDCIIPLPTAAEYGGYKNAQRWREGNWGTQQAYDIKITRQNTKSVEIWFNTKWYPPIPIYTTISTLFPKLVFVVSFASDDDFEDGYGIFKLLGGVDIDPLEIKPNSKEAYKLIIETTKYGTPFCLIELCAYEEEGDIDEKALAMIDMLFQERVFDPELPPPVLSKLEEMAVKEEDFEFAIKLRDLKKI